MERERLQLQECTVIPYHAAVSHITKRFMSYCYINCHITIRMTQCQSVSLTVQLQLRLHWHRNAFLPIRFLSDEWELNLEMGRSTKVLVHNSRSCNAMSHTHDECVINCECRPQSFAHSMQIKRSVALILQSSGVVRSYLVTVLVLTLWWYIWVKEID